ncbi:MAG: hypothetical protein AAB425_10980 [Bdellovibrionota bacterium]
MSDTESHAQFFPENETLRLTADGIWYSDSTEITHVGTLQLFGRSIVRKAGTELPLQYHLVVGRETKEVFVEDTAFFVTRVDRSGSGAYRLHLTDGTQMDLGVRDLAFRPPNRLTSAIRGGAETARFCRNAYHDILKDLEQDAGGYFLQIASTKVYLDSSSITP